MSWLDPQVPQQPILVVLVWRGGARFQRALDSILKSEQYFRRVILSITSAPNSTDMQIATAYLRYCEERGEPSKAEIICTGAELPTMQHQEFWISYLEETGVRASDWICWLAYDDELRPKGLSAITDAQLNWKLDPQSTYLGPWLIRHEGASELWNGDLAEPIEEWTCFSKQHEAPIAVQTWISQQLLQPTYIQMSGSIAPFGNHAWLVRGPVRKTNPMRIEMATALSGEGRYVTELAEAITIIYGRPNSDRANYGSAARREDWHLAKLLILKCMNDPRAILNTFSCFFSALKRAVQTRIPGHALSPEEWRVRGRQTP